MYQTDPSVGTYINRGNVIESLPKFRNPILSVILSRYSSNTYNEKAKSSKEIKEFLANNLSFIPDDNTAPDLVIAGKDNFLAIGYKKGTESIPTLFYPDNEFWVGYQNVIKSDMAYGIFLCHLMSCLNWIRLGRMPWIEMLNQAKLE